MTLVLRWKQPQKPLTLRWRVKDANTIYQAALRGPDALAAVLAPTGPQGLKGDKGDPGEGVPTDNGQPVIDGGFF